MAQSDPTAWATSQPPQDTQTLIHLLGSLMPLLLRLQSSQGVDPYRFAPTSPANVTPDPLIDQQAAVNLVEDITADSLRTLSSYLEMHVGRYPGLENVVPLVTQAAHCFAARDFAQAFNLIWQAYRAITLMRATNP